MDGMWAPGDRRPPCTEQANGSRPSAGTRPYSRNHRTGRLPHDWPELILGHVRNGGASAPAGAPFPGTLNGGFPSGAETIAPPSADDSGTAIGTAASPTTDAEAEDALGYVSVGRSAATHVRLIASMAVAGLVIGSAFAMVRSPVYHGEARLIVGKSVSITNVAATAGLPAADAQLAADYSRLAGTEAVKADAAKRLGHPSSLGGGITASPIADSPIIRVDASASSSKAAVALANAGAQAIMDQVNAINQSNAAGLNDLTKSYAQIEFNLNQDTELVNTLTAELANPALDRAVLQAQLNRAKAAVAVDNLEASAVESQYQNQYSPVQSDAQVVNLASAATYTGSDRKSFLEIGVAGGLIGGAIVGTAAAVLVDMRASRRRSRRW